MLDFSQKKTYGPIDEGTYELNIETAEFGQTEGGINYISLIYVVRSDVEQEFQDAKIWDNIWENEVYVNKVNGRTLGKDKYNKLPPAQKANYTMEMQYSDFKIRPLIQAQDADPEIKDENGDSKPNPDYKTSFASMDEVVFFLNGLNVKAGVEIVTDSSGKEKNVINYKEISRTEFSDDLPF